MTNTNPTIILNLPSKFICLLQETVVYRINSMQKMLDNPKITEEQLSEIDYGHDLMILKSINDELKNTNNKVMAEFYQLSQNADATETTLQLFGKPIDKGHQLIFVFSAKSYNEAMTIKNRFLGFELYKPIAGD